MCPGEPDSRCSGKPAEPAGGSMPVHPRATAVEQQRPGSVAADGAVDGPADCRGQRDQDDLAAFAADPQDPVAVFLAQIADIRAGSFEDPQTQQAEVGIVNGAEALDNRAPSRRSARL
jgi:hypothetical protein